MYCFDDLWAGEVQTLVIAFQFLGASGENIPPVVFFGQAVSLDHRTHRTIQNQYLIFDCVFYSHSAFCF